MGETVEIQHTVCSEQCEERMKTHNNKEQKEMLAALERYRQQTVAQDAVAAAKRFRNPALKKDDVENIPIDNNEEQIKAICRGFDKELIDAAAAAAQQRAAALEI